MNTSIIRVIIADDHEIFLDGLETLLAREKDIQLIARAATGAELLALVQEHRPDVVVTDLRMPDRSAIEIIAEINAMPNRPASIIISMYGDEHIVMEAATCGAMGYVTKGTGKEEVVEAIRAVYKGDPYYCQEASKVLLKNYIGVPGPPKDAFTPVHFSAEQKEIIILICDGMTSKEIGQALHKGQRWVESMRREILKLIDGRTVLDVYKYAVKNGLYKA